MFISIGNRKINLRYVKEIQPTFIIVANTQVSSVASSGPYTSLERTCECDDKIDIRPDQYKSIISQLDYPNIIREQQNEIEQLKLQIRFMPPGQSGGLGYQAAKTEFDTLK